MALDPTIRVTDLVTAFIFLTGGIWFIWSMRNEVRMLARDVRVHSMKLDKLEAVITSLAVQNQRLNDLDKRIEELRHWRGFVNPNGEYDRYGKIKDK
jgi:hypothetical protein